MNNNNKNKDNIMKVTDLIFERETLKRDLAQDTKDYYGSKVMSLEDLAKENIYSAKLFIERLEELIENNKGN